MSSVRAIQLVKKLLEYGFDSEAPRPGGPEDPWRNPENKYSPLKFRRGDFEGTRLGSLAPGAAPVGGPQQVPDDDFLNPEDLLDEPPGEEVQGATGMPPAAPPTPPPPPPKRVQPMQNIHPRFKWRPPPSPGP